MTLQVLNSISVQHQESSTVHKAIGIAWSGWNSWSSILITLASSQHNLYDLYLLLCTVLDSWWWQRYCPKHVKSYSKYKFEKLVLLVGFIIRIYQNALSSEYQIWYLRTRFQEKGVFTRYASSKAFVSCHVHFAILIKCHLLWFQCHLDWNIINLQSVT